MSDLDQIIILVPQGREYQAICKGLGLLNSKRNFVFSIPMGTPGSLYLKQWQQTQEFFDRSPTRILLMGLCGSLSPQYKVGDIVIYQSCCLETQNFVEEKCDRDLTKLISDRLQGKAYSVRGLTCDRVIWSAQEKLQLGQTYQADVVDMEGYTTIKILARAGIAIAIVRVVSDSCRHDIPNLTSAIDSKGSLKPLALAIEMAQNPLAAMKLISGSLKGLKVLQQVTKELFSKG
jgi:purine-nucleoside phosphorylase